MVVVGMTQNPVVKSVRKQLSQAGIDYFYLEYGSYFSQWYRRLTLKMWTGWPTFPMVFVEGVLVGGDSNVKELIEAGQLTSKRHPA
jgi:glutaredoxin-related protein